MSKYDEFHEVERVVFQSAAPQSRLALYSFFLARSFELNDDFHHYFLDYEAEAKPHQAITLVKFSVLSGGVRNEAYQKDFAKTDHFWDALEAEYLFASLPIDCIVKFVQECAALSERFGLSMHRGEHVVSQRHLQEEFERIGAELTEAYGEPGSERLSMQIELTYPRPPKT